MSAGRSFSLTPPAVRPLPGLHGPTTGTTTIVLTPPAPSGPGQAGPGLAEAMVAAAVAEAASGRRAEAAARLAALSPANVAPGTLLHAARLLLTVGAAGQALPWFDHGLRLDPASAPLLAGRARSLRAMGRAAEALAAYTEAVQAGCDDPAVHFEHGSLLQAAGRLPGAIAAYDKALRLRPAYPEALRAGGGVLRDLGYLDGALRFLGEACRLAPDDLLALLDHTTLLMAMGRQADAVAAYDAALARKPGQPDLLNNRGVALQDLGHLTDARASFAAAVGADPGHAPGHLNLGNALVWSGEPDAALAAFNTALTLRPDYPEALCSLGVALRTLGRLDEAMAAFDRALAMQPDFPHARTNRGELLLLTGDYPRGWPDYAERFRAGRQTRPALPRPAPEWHGEPLPPGTRLAVLADQGNGDMIQFARFLPVLAAQGLAVTFVCPARLHRVLAPVTAGVSVVASVSEDAAFDREVTLSNLPQATGVGPGTIPAAPAYLSAQPALVSRWAERIGSDGFRVGLCWRGNQRWQADPRRSLPLEAFAPLADLPGLRLFSLQMPDNVGEEEAALFERLRLDPLGAELDRGPDSFCDTAAALMSLDCVVTCDTSMVHLAGALGRPTFVLLQAFPEWRWMLGRADSPWYPSVTLLRQQRLGDWAAPLAELETILLERSGART